MIHTSRIITVGKEESTLNDPIILYRGDRQVEVEFEIIGSDYTYTNGDNVIKTTNATHGQLVLNTPTGNNMFSDVTNCEDGKVIFIITGEMIDELEEVGFYSFQIRLFDESQGSRVTLPPIYKGVDIRNPIASEDQNNFVGSAIVDYAEIQNDNNQEIPTFDAFGDYNKTEWVNRDVITSNKLNKIENALYEVNNTTNKSKIELDLKVDKDHIWSMSNMGQDIKEAMTGGSVAVVGINSISTDNIRDKQITGRKISDGSISESKLRESGKLYNVMGEIDFEFSNHYISTNGTLNPMEGWYVSYPISMECMPIEVIVDSSSYIPGIWVDDSYRYTEDISKKIVDNYDGTYSITFNYPTSSASKYLRINHNDSNISSIRFSSNGCINTKHLKNGIITREKLSKDFKITNDIISNDSITGDKLVKAGSIIDMTHYPIEHIGYYIDDLGRLTALRDWKVTCPIDITNISYIIYKSSQTPALLGCFFDDNDSYITGVKYSTEEQDGIYITTINCNDKNHKYIRLNIWNKTISISRTTDSGDIDTIHLKNGCITQDKLSEEVLYMINKTKNNNKYIDLHYSRSCISEFLDKLQDKTMLNVVCIGDSITNFQNSEILDMEEQKTAPLGLQGNSWVRRLWKLLNYNVYNDDRSIKNENGNLGFKRYDHEDFNFVGGYQGNNSELGEYKWATNRNDTPDSWRDNSHSGYPQIITPESSYNKMMVGSNIVGASCSVTIPEDAIGMSIIFGASSGNVDIKINDGDSKIVDTNVILNGEAYELHKEYSFSPGNEKIITLTLVSGGVWIYGVEYWTDKCVRVINSGLAGNTVGSVVTNFNKLISGFNGDINNVDLIVWEVNALNDARVPLSTTRSHARTIFNKIKELGIPMLTIMTHRHEKGMETLQYDRYNPIYGSTITSGTELVGNIAHYPSYIKMYKTLAYNNNCAIIDMYSKSVDICGGLMNTAKFPDGFFVDGIHLGVIGNECYEEEFRNLFMWNDYE